MRRICGLALYGVGLVWLWACFLLTGYGYWTVWRDHGFWAMWEYMQAWNDPFSLRGAINLVFQVVAFAPGMGLMYGGQKLLDKADQLES